MTFLIKKLNILLIITFYSFFLTHFGNALENKILYKVNNEIITSFDLKKELRYLSLINPQILNLEKKYNKQYLKINSGIEKNSGYYIFALRMCVVFPFFMVNLLLGLTTIKPINYYLISQLGMLPATVIIVSLGDKIAGAFTSDISIDFTLVMLLTALGLLPLLSRLFFKKILD